MGGGYDV